MSKSELNSSVCRKKSRIMYSMPFFKMSLTMLQCIKSILKYIVYLYSIISTLYSIVFMCTILRECVYYIYISVQIYIQYLYICIYHIVSISLYIVYIYLPKKNPNEHSKYDRRFDSILETSKFRHHSILNVHGTTIKYILTPPQPNFVTPFAS